MSSDKSNQLLIREAIRKIALGHSMERINLTPGGMSGIGTARMIHGYVAKKHDDPSDEEFSDYGGTIDVGEYPDETASAEPVIHRGVLLSAATNSEGGFMIVPTLFSDVTIFMDAATRYAYVVNFSHVDILRLNARKETVIGMTEMEEMNPDSDSSPDYDEVETTGNGASTRYTPTTVITTIKNDKNKEAVSVLEAESITHTVGKSEVRQTADKVVQKVNFTTIAVSDSKVTFGDENASEPLVIGNELAGLMLDFLTECSKIMTPTLMGTMSPINIPNFTSLTSRIQKFLSKTSYTK
ncbi:hypothetical protein [Bacteroides helcogenes]|uniref:Uncharacterized protein n=1 Tax=Bacteroides helcogenes (strain ATCC 35417 / DSM 20613 / JCM 6297 / CCUG 15421 / P 36-108) TaxID=693979 RepID=E6SVB6_BACT6|nr:hypothetical protein [Bacteroides helcogenes]ADV44482.1 hypothetical protein Bache_2517 [Bacteroides helcogenes P 36-108]MDY5237132.1 hypothetical protein [Bacteroides helcogenes]